MFKSLKNINLFGRIYIIILILFLCISLSSCTVFKSMKNFFTEGFSIEDDIRKITEVLNSFFDSIKDKNYRKAYEYLSSSDKSGGSLEDFKQDLANITDIISININYIEINNDVAIAGIDLTDSYDGEEKFYEDIEVSLVREEDGIWKIVFWNLEDEQN